MSLRDIVSGLICLAALVPFAKGADVPRLTVAVTRQFIETIDDVDATTNSTYYWIFSAPASPPVPALVDAVTLATNLPASTVSNTIAGRVSTFYQRVGLTNFVADVRLP